MIWLVNGLGFVDITICLLCALGAGAALAVWTEKGILLVSAAACGFCTAENRPKSLELQRQSVTGSSSFFSSLNSRELYLVFSFMSQKCISLEHLQLLTATECSLLWLFFT